MSSEKTKALNEAFEQGVRKAYREMTEGRWNGGRFVRPTGIGPQGLVDLMKGFGIVYEPPLEQLPERAHARHADPSTSHDAAKKINVSLGQRQILFIFKKMPMGPHTDHAIAEWYEHHCSDWVFLYTDQQSASSLRSRRAELVKAGYLKDSGQKHTLPTGNKAVAWERTVKGAFPSLEDIKHGLVRT